MSVYFVKGKGWRYDFTLRKTRYTNAWFKTKKEAWQAEAKRREEIKNPKPEVKRPIDMDFFELVQKRLDHVKAYNSGCHYRDTRSVASHWVAEWEGCMCSEISTDMIRQYLLKRSDVSGFTANRDLVYMRTLFNFGLKRHYISMDPTEDIESFPTEKTLRCIPQKEDVLKVIMAADGREQAYLWTITLTLAREGEVNRLTWQDVDLEKRVIVLYTRKKQGGHLTPRNIQMCDKLYDILFRLYQERDKTKPWVFWHRYWNREDGNWVEGPYQSRSKLMKTLCRKAGVRYFRFHPLRHFGASLLDQEKVNIGTIQRVLGHENRRTTEIYLHSIGDAEREAMRVFDRAFGDSHTDSHTENEKRVSQVG